MSQLWERLGVKQPVCIYCDERATSTAAGDLVCDKHRKEYEKIGEQWNGFGESPSEAMKMKYKESKNGFWK